MRMASRMARARESGTARIARITSEREVQGERILKLNIGEPDFDTPDFIVGAALRAMAEGKTRYTDVAGTRELREAAAEKFRSENSIDCTSDQVVIGTGAKQLIFNALMATLEKGDEAIIPTPSWVSYPDIASIAGAKPVVVPCGGGAGFKLTAEQLEKALSGRTRWLILNSPCNPTGAVYSAGELRDLADWLRHHPQVGVLCDDIYEKIVFHGAEFSTMAEVAPDLSDRILTVNGVSKSHAMTGWRIGYAVGPRPLIAAMIKLQSQSTTNASSIGQAAALAALTRLELSNEFVSGCLSAYQRRRDLILKGLSRISGLDCSPPEGAFYAFVSCRSLFGRTIPGGSVLSNDSEFCEYLLRQAGVSVVPGSEFGGEGYFRLCFAASEETLEEACERIHAAVDALG